MILKNITRTSKIDVIEKSDNIVSKYHVELESIRDEILEIASLYFYDCYDRKVFIKKLNRYKKQYLKIIDKHFSDIKKAIDSINKKGKTKWN